MKMQCVQNLHTLPAITLLIAESSPKDKEKMIGLVCGFLTKRKSNGI